MEKDLQLQYLIEIKDSQKESVKAQNKTNVEMAKTNEHLKTLNGQVKANKDDIKENRGIIDKSNLTLAMYAGGIILINFLLVLGVTVWLNR